MRKGHRKSNPEFMQLLTDRAAPKGKRARAPKATPPPAHLDDDAKRAWFLLEPQIRGMGVTIPDYLVPFERMCAIYGTLTRLERLIAQQGEYYETVDSAGNKVPKGHPAIPRFRELERRFESYLSEFGLTPASRAGLMTKLRGQQRPTPNAPRQDPVEEFFA